MLYALAFIAGFTTATAWLVWLGYRSGKRKEAALLKVFGSPEAAKRAGMVLHHLQNPPKEK